MQEHRYLKEVGATDPNLVRILSLDILNYYHKPPIHSKKRWIEKKTFVRNWTTAQGQPTTSAHIGYEIVSEELEKTRSFSPNRYNLFPMESVWLDHSLAVAKLINQRDQPFIELATEHVYGTTNPITIRLDRPGIAATSMMNHLFRHVIKGRAAVIDHSDKMLSLTWYLELRNVICDAVSLVDMTLNRLHYEAQNNPNPNWKVSPTLGPRHGGRLLDKLSFVYQCTGSNLPTIGSEKAALTRLKDFRNQFMHFDPPYFVHEFSELVILLNDIIALGMLIYKIRKTIGAEISSDLIEFMLQREVELVLKNEVIVAVAL